MTKTLFFIVYMEENNSFRYFKTRPEVIRLAVVKFIKFPLMSHTKSIKRPLLTSAFDVKGDIRVCYYIYYLQVNYCQCNTGINSFKIVSI